MQFNLKYKVLSLDVLLEDYLLVVNLKRLDATRITSLSKLYQ